MLKTIIIQTVRQIGTITNGTNTEGNVAEKVRLRNWEIKGVGTSLEKLLTSYSDDVFEVLREFFNEEYLTNFKEKSDSDKIAIIINSVREVRSEVMRLNKRGFINAFVIGNEGEFPLTSKYIKNHILG